MTLSKMLKGVVTLCCLIDLSEESKEDKKQQEETEETEYEHDTDACAAFSALDDEGELQLALLIYNCCNA